jgi:hypothetical protein
MKTKTKYLAALFSTLALQFLNQFSARLGMPLPFVAQRALTVLTCVSIGFTFFYMVRQTQEKRMPNSVATTNVFLGSG